MYIVTKNKKKIFTSKNKDKKIESILVDVKEFKDEQGGINRTFVYDIFVEVDKREMINKDIKNIKVELSKTPLHKLNIRESMLKGVNLSDTKELHYAVTNAKDIRIKSMLGNKTAKNRPVKDAAKISSLDIFKKSKISKAKKFNLGDNQVFGTRKTLRLSRSRRKNKKFDTSTEKNILSFDIEKNKKRKRKLFNKPGLFLKNKSKKLFRSGIDPSAYVADVLKSKQSQSTIQGLRGRISRVDKNRRSPIKDLIKKSLQANAAASIANNY